MGASSREGTPPGRSCFGPTGPDERVALNACRWGTGVAPAAFPAGFHAQAQRRQQGRGPSADLCALAPLREAFPAVGRVCLPITGCGEAAQQELRPPGRALEGVGPAGPSLSGSIFPGGGTPPGRSCFGPTGPDERVALNACRWGTGVAPAAFPAGFHAQAQRRQQGEARPHDLCALAPLRETFPPSGRRDRSSMILDGSAGASPSRQAPSDFSSSFNSQLIERPGGSAGASPSRGKEAVLLDPMPSSPAALPPSHK